MRKTRFTLQKPDYDQAIEAFRLKVPIEVSGDLVKEGRFWTLRAPRNLRVIAEEEEAAEE